MLFFVTGGHGFLGTILCQRLRERGHQVVAPTSKECNLLEAGPLEKFTQHTFDGIIHLAAWTQAGDFCLKHPGEQWLRNQLLNTHMLQWWQQHQPQAKFVAMGTSCAYASDRELTEENYLLGEPIESLYTYAMTKRMLFIGMQSIAKQFGSRYLCLVPSTLYGPGYHTDGRQMHFIFDLIRKILIASEGGPAPVLWGDGHQKRELVHIDDFTAAMIPLVETQDNLLVNIGAGTEYSIREFAQAICKIISYDFNLIQFDTSRYVGARSKVLSIDRLKQLIPSYQPRSLQEGLTDTITWFRANWESMKPAYQAA